MFEEAKMTIFLGFVSGDIHTGVTETLRVDHMDTTLSSHHTMDQIHGWCTAHGSSKRDGELVH